MEFTKGQKQFAWGAVIVTALAGVSWYLYRQYQYLYNATYRISNAIIHNIALNNIKVTIKIKLTNKGDLSAWITQQSYDIKVNGTFVANIKNLMPVHINSNGDTFLPLTIEFNPSKLLSTAVQNITSFLIDRSKIIFTIRGTLSLTAGVLTLKDFVFDMKYTMQELIDISKAPVDAHFSGFENTGGIQSVEELNHPDGTFNGYMLGYNVRMDYHQAYPVISTMEYRPVIKFKTNVGLRNVVPAKVKVKIKDKRAYVNVLPPNFN